MLLGVSVKSEEKLALSVPASYAVIADEDLYHIVLAIVNDFKTVQFVQKIVQIQGCQ